MMKKSTFAFAARPCEGCGTVAIDLGATEAIVDGEGVRDLDLVQVRLLDAVKDGGLLKLDAVRGEELAEAIGMKTFGGEEAIRPDKWYGILPALALAVGPYDRKSQAMNGIVLALAGIELRVKEQEPHGATDIDGNVDRAIPMPDESGLRAKSPAAAFGLSEAQKAHLRGKSPEVVDALMTVWKDTTIEPLAGVLDRLDPSLGKELRAMADKQIAELKQSLTVH